MLQSDLYNKFKHSGLYVVLIACFLSWFLSNVSAKSVVSGGQPGNGKIEKSKLEIHGNMRDHETHHMSNMHKIVAAHKIAVHHITKVNTLRSKSPKAMKKAVKKTGAGSNSKTHKAPFHHHK